MMANGRIHGHGAISTAPSGYEDARCATEDDPEWPIAYGTQKERFRKLRDHPAPSSRKRVDGRLVEGDRRAEPSGETWNAALQRGVMTLHDQVERSEEPTSELQSLMRLSYAVFSLK